MKKIILLLLLLAIVSAGCFFLVKAASEFELGDAYRIDDFEWFSLQQSGDELPLYKTLDNQPAPVLSPQESLSAFSIAPGFEVELVAAEPLVEEPVAMAWDEYGRLYVVEMRSYMLDAYGGGSDLPVGRVTRLEDTNGDGLMDTSDIFLGGLVNPRAVAVVNEGILIAEPPNLWLCELPTPNALCDNKRIIGSYGADAETANVEHMENGLMQGLDNWLYNSKSSRSLRIKAGELVEREGFFRGQWGITKDDFGRLLYNHNSTWLQADFFAAEDLVQPGEQVYPDGLGVNLTNPAKVYSVRVNPGVNRAYLPGTLRADGRLNEATGVSGLVSYRGDQFPDRYHADVFVPEIAGNVVAQFAISEDGIALKASQRLYDDEKWGKRGFLGSTDERFRPVDAMNGPDGALYIIDMYRGIVQHDYYMTDELREQVFERELEAPVGMGRIWRVRHAGGKVARNFPDFVDASDTELILALSHSNGWARDTAQRLLLSRGGDQTLALAAIASGDNTVAALHAIWTLHARGELRRELVMRIARFDDTQRQVQALRAGRSLLSAADLVTLYEALSPEPADALSMQLAFAMGDHAADPSVRRSLASLLRADLAVPYIRQAVVRAVAGEELSFLREYLNSKRLEAVSDAARDALSSLASGAYRSLRGDITSGESANTALLELLALAASRSNDNAWQQIALLEGMQGVAVSADFVPAALQAPPEIFTDGSISEQDPLWTARMGGRIAFTWPGDELAMGIMPLSPEQLAAMALGEHFYLQCGTCHSADGTGIAGLAPSLVGSSWVTGPPEWLSRIILQGLNGPVEVKGEIWNGVMPAHRHLPELNDETLAGLMTYVRRSWGNKADPVSVSTAAQSRAASADRKLPWTVPELKAVPYDRGYGRFEGAYAISFVTFTVSEKSDGLYLDVPMYGGGLMEPINATTFMAGAGGENVKLEFIVDEDGAVNTMLMYRKGEKILIKRKE